MRRILPRTAALICAAVLTTTGAIAPAAGVLPASERGAAACLDPHDVGAGARGSDNLRSPDHRDVSASEQRVIERRTARILAGKSTSRAGSAQLAAATVVPVYVHVMRGADGSGDVTDEQIAAQIAVLNKTFGGGESELASNTGFSFVLTNTARYSNSQWHLDEVSSQYRSATRQGGADALNIWVVDFDFLGIATFPWDFAKMGTVDGIRVDFESLPGGSFGTEFSLGKTATHEAAHWLGLFHTFQGGCTTTNDGVADTPAQSGPSSGCPVGLDSCSLAGLDPIHNYMDYSWDSCYTQFTADQTSRMTEMFAAHRM